MVEKETCSGLNENVPHRFMYLNIWCLDGETFWEGLRGVAFLEEVSLRAGFEVSKDLCHYQIVSPPSPAPLFLCLMLVDQCVIFISATMP